MVKLARSAALLISICSGLAQTPSASVVGRVTDASGAVVAAVIVTVTNLDTHIRQKASSNEVGDFTVPYLNPGRYALEDSTGGFRTYRRSEFRLAVDRVLRIAIPLEIGAGAESTCRRTTWT